MEEKIYQGYVYRRAGPGQPWQMAGPAQPRGGMVIRDPYAASEQARKQESQRLDESRYNLSERQFSESQQNNAESDARSNRSERISNPQALRKEYMALPEVREYKVAAQMAAAALNAAATPQGDISLTYAYAKAMDPGSVVREQETATLSNSQPWLESAAQQIKKQFGMDNAGQFTPQARQAIRGEILRSLQTRKRLYDTRRAEFVDLAGVNGIKPVEVVGRDDTESYAPQFRAYAEKVGDPDGVVASIIGGDPIQQMPAQPQGQSPAQPMAPAGYGATESAIPIPDGLRQAHDKYLQDNWGKLNARDYTAFRINLDRQFGFGSNPEGYAKTADDLNKAAAAGAQPGAYIPPVKQELSGLDQVRNNMLSDQYGIGAGVAAGLNAGGLGIPSLFARGQMDALREANPIATTIGDIGGGVVGTGVAGGLLRGAAAKVANPSVAAALANPLAADLAYGATYGATQADDPLYGAAGGAGAAFAGNRLGSAIGRTFPGITGLGRRQAALDASVPTSQQLKQEASALYNAAENTGEQITGAETYALNDRFNNLLRAEGRLSPKDRLTDVQPKVKEAAQLVGDYAGEPMTPKQVQTIRSVIGDGVTSTDNAERRIARMMLADFDQWTDGVSPQMAQGLAEARGVASRYLQGDEIALARDLADVRAGQFTNSGQGNALRTDFRQLDRKIAKGQENFSPAVEEAIANVARGDRTTNAFRAIGRFAPTGAFSSGPTGAAAALGALSGGLPGAGLAAAALAVPTFAARELGQRATARSAQIAENLAYGGPAYQQGLEMLLDDAAARGGHGGASIGSEVARALLSYGGY